MHGPIETCPVRGVIAGIGDKWSVLVLLHLSAGDLRFAALQRTVPDLSQRVLTVTLRKLQRNGLVWRAVKPTTPPQVSYGLTPLGITLIQHLQALACWANANRDKVEAARLAFDGEPALSQDPKAGFATA